MRGASATAQKLQTGRHEQPGWRTELQAAKNTLHAAQAAHPSRQAARPVVIGGCDDGDEFTEPLVTKAAFEAAWGGCHRSGWRPVLVALPYSADMLCDLQVLMFTNLKSLECANEGFNLHLGLYDKPYQNDMDARKTKKSGRGVLATLRNALLQEYLRPEHEYVLWLDADVVEYPPDLVGQLHGLNPGGVSAPLVLIEDSDTERFHSPAPPTPRPPRVGRRASLSPMRVRGRAPLPPPALPYGDAESHARDQAVVRQALPPVLRQSGLHRFQHQHLAQPCLPWQLAAVSAVPWRRGGLDRSTRLRRRGLRVGGHRLHVSCRQCCSLDQPCTAGCLRLPALCQAAGRGVPRHVRGFVAARASLPDGVHGALSRGPRREVRAGRADSHRDARGGAARQFA